MKIKKPTVLRSGIPVMAASLDQSFYPFYNVKKDRLTILAKNGSLKMCANIDDETVELVKFKNTQPHIFIPQNIQRFPY